MDIIGMLPGKRGPRVGRKLNGCCYTPHNPLHPNMRAWTTEQDKAWKEEEEENQGRKEEGSSQS